MKLAADVPLELFEALAPKSGYPVAHVPLCFKVVVGPNPEVVTQALAVPESAGLIHFHSLLPGRKSAGPGMAADAHDKLAAAHQAAQVAGSDPAVASAAASDAAVAGIDKPLTAAGMQQTSGGLAAAPHASAGPVAAPDTASDPALAGIDKPIRAASSQAAVAQSAAVASASTPAASTAAVDGQQAAGGQDAASAAAPGPGDAVQQQLLSQRVCGSPAIDGWAVYL